MSDDVHLKSSVGVIGAGIQGICVSLFLVKRGFKVTLIDREEPGKNSASYGNAGHFSPYASVPLNRPGVLLDVPAMLLSTTGPLAIKWNYVPKMIPWFLKFDLEKPVLNHLTYLIYYSYTKPWSNIASATFINPDILAPLT